MSCNNEKEIVSGIEITTREQKKKETFQKRRENFKAFETTKQIDSKISINNSGVPTSSLGSNGKVESDSVSKGNELNLRAEDFELPENKKSLGTKPFKIVVPGKEPILEFKSCDEQEDSLSKNEEIKKTNNETEKSSKEILSKKIVSGRYTSLFIEIMESAAIKTGTFLKINPDGLDNSKRGAKDGKTFFGTYEGHDQSKINDYIFPSSEVGFGRRHFVIKYNVDKDAYSLQNLGDGTGTFIKITGHKELTENVIVSFNNIHIGIIVSHSKQSKISLPIVKYSNNQNTDE